MQSERPPIIAIVDDDALVRDAVGLALRAEGWSVHEYPSGQALLSSLGDGDLPQTIVLDLTLTDMTGLDVLGQLNARGFVIPVIILTALPSSPQAVAALSQGALAVMGKPATYDELTQAVERALALRG